MKVKIMFLFGLQMIVASKRVAKFATISKFEVK
jgi:hypothetical protein